MTARRPYDRVSIGNRGIATFRASIAAALAGAVAILAACTGGGSAPPITATAWTITDPVAAYDRRDYATAFAGFRSLADQGNADAQYNLGVMYSNGHGVSQNHAEAAKWYRRAADQGHAAAQYNLGTMYSTGDSVLQNHAEAAKWYRHAADRGHAAAQYNLGVMYSTGDSVLQNDAEATKWYRRAAEQGHATAQFHLGVSYDNGLGISKDHVRAYMWFNLAAAEMPAAETDRRAEAIRNRDRVARLLSPEALARAQRLARERKLESGAGPVVRSAPSSTGSGFRVNADGSILTNAHVVHDCAEVRVPPAGRADVVARDEVADLALIDGPPGAAAAFRRSRVGRGADVVVVGYPLSGNLAAGANSSEGTVSALAGPYDNPGMIQITAPIQPGNSGGPVLDEAGNAVGVVVGSFNWLHMARKTGRLPQNLNFAVSAATARAFLDSEGVPYKAASSNRDRANEEVVKAASEFTVLIECWK